MKRLLIAALAALSISTAHASEECQRVSQFFGDMIESYAQGASAPVLRNRIVYLDAGYNAKRYLNNVLDRLQYLDRMAFTNHIVNQQLKATVFNDCRRDYSRW